MGLTIGVGIYSGLVNETNKPLFSLQFQAVNAALQEIGLRPHQEPTDVKSWTAEGYGYSGLHALREVAGIISKNLPIPRKTLITGKGETHHEDVLFKEALANFNRSSSLGLFGHLIDGIYQPGIPPFVHLIFHSDANGFYIPLDFPMPIAPSVFEESTAEIWPLGSSHRLKAEIDLLASALEIPDDLDSQDDALWQAFDDPISDKALWLAQPIAAYSAVILRDACKASIATGAAIVFA
jgi:hypothetical protein